MKPRTFTITADEQTKVYQALTRGLWCANQLVAHGVIGADAYAGQIADALEIMNRPCEGGFESEQERSAFSMKKLIRENAAHGNK